MTGSALNSTISTLRGVWWALQLQGRALAERASDRLRPDLDHRPTRHLAIRRSRWLRRALMVGGAGAVAAFAACGVVWWQLGSGPISIDVMTPWLTPAIEERLGGHHRIEVGGTMLERDEVGRSALRLRDIVVRDAQGTVVASAPKAEVGIASLGLLSGRVQTDRMSLIGAEMALRIEPNGNVNLLAGAGKPAVEAPATTSSIPSTGALVAKAESARLPPVEVASSPLAAVLAWIDKLDSLGLDGGSLAEIGLKDCTLVVED